MSDIEQSVIHVAQGNFTFGRNAEIFSPLSVPFKPDVVIIRQISFSDRNNQNTYDTQPAYLVWSNITNNYVGSIVNFCPPSTTMNYNSGSQAFPQTHIYPSSPIPNVLHFQLRRVNGTTLQLPTNFIEGTLIITLEIIKKRK